MIIRQFILAAALVLGSVAAVQSAPPKETWIGAWGFVPIPLPPGLTPAVAATTSPAIPLAASLPAQPSPAAPSALLIDNPGNLPVMAAESDPSNVTIRQLVRVAVAGFGDVGAAAHRFSPGTAWQVDVGAGIRVKLPGADGVMRVDVAHGTRDGANALTVGWLH